MELVEIIKAAFDQIADDPALFVVDIREQSGKKTKITVIIDSDLGLTSGDCVKVSRNLGQFLEEKNLLPEQSVLEVSSPGADKPLLLPRQYGKHIGRRLNVQLVGGESLSGLLKDVQLDSGITLEVEVEPEEPNKKKKKAIETTDKTFSFAEVEKAIVEISFR